MTDERTELAQRSGGNQEGALAIATTRSAQEVQAAMVVAKRFPRDMFAAQARILDACKRPVLAEQALYAYPRGGTTVEGPSIRMAEVLAQNWGNIDFGIIELEQKQGESSVMAYAWDLETNTRQTKIFTVPHLRHTKQGDYKLTDPRDIYEMVANQGARRVRACILGIIPGDIIDSAVAACNKTMAGQSDEPLMDRAKKMVIAFEKIGVSKDMLEKRLGHRLDVITETELATFRKIFKSIQDNMQPVSAFFGEKKTVETAEVDVNDVLGDAREETTEPGGNAETAPQPKAETTTEPQPPVDAHPATEASDGDMFGNPPSGGRKRK